MHARRGLHQPFFPLASSSPPPGESPLSFAAPELPFFFPVYSSPLPPPPQPPAAVVSHPTFPASVSSLAGPPPTSFRDYKPAIAVLLALLALLAAAAAMYFFYRRRLLCWFDKEGARSDSQRLFDCVASDGGAAPKSSPRVSSVFGSKLWSPELRPIPWLPRHTRGRGEEKAVEDSSGREFYSPRPSSAWKGSSGRWESGRISSSQRTLPAAVAERCESRSSALDTPPYLSSPLVSSARFASSPGHSSRRSLRSTSERISPGDCCVTTPPPPLETLSAKTKVATFDLYTHRQRQNGVPRAPPPPPPPPAGYWERQVLRPPTTQPNDQMTISDGREKNEDATRPKLKPLHWDKLPASSNRAMVWDQLKSSSFRVNEEAMETLFVCNTTKEMNKVLQVLPLPPQATTVLDPKRSQNIAILLRSLNSTKEEVCEALLEGNAERLETEQLEILLKMAPNQEEENKLKEYKDDSSPFNLGPEEKFLKALLDIPFPFKRAEAMLFMATFDSEVNFLNKSFLTLETACEELRSSRLFLKLLEAVLKTGNRMNIGTNRGGARAFKLDTLLKLVDIKSNDGKTTLLHFVTEEVIRSEGDSFPSATSNVAVSALERRKLGLQAVAGLAQELCNVKAAAAMDSDALDSYVSKLAGGYGKINEVLRLNEALGREEYTERFHEAMYESMRRAEEGIIKVQAQESAAMSVVKETTDYFHGDSAKEEAHPLRIFVVVRDFLSILERVCKEIGSIEHRHIFVTSEPQFPVPVNPTLSAEFA